MSVEKNRDIRAEIAGRRALDVQSFGAAQGLKLPEERALPVVPFLQDPRVICEIKRKSPSVSNIDTSLDPVELARKYSEAGIRSISVLTEQNYFSGSLADLIAVKTALPEMAVLRKDFLLTEEDVEVSFRAGADAFLLIASLLDADRLKSMYELGIKLGMTPVVELHSQDDIDRASGFKPELVGINSRDLRVFKIKPLQPLKIRSMIDWACRIIYESGIKTEYDIDFVKGTEFDAVLVGEATVRDSGFAGKLAAAFETSALGTVAFGDSLPASKESERFAFFRRLYGRCKPGRPLVKICGITNHEDLRKVISLGADAAGFILAESPRKVSPTFIESCRDFDILKVGVVVLLEGQPLPDEIAALLSSGALDAVQFHGNELPSQYLQYPGYKAVRIKTAEDAEAAGRLPGPVVLIDAFSEAAYGGTGKQISPKLVQIVAGQQTLWLAGGIKPENVCRLVSRYRPELIDISSGVELSPGKKDHDRLTELFSEISRAGESGAEE
ncbi:MAG TPA: bifunctional indole-3-glycerol phosphate synthase/phosphoribosylanthranilate isomerase [Spirochaeta sp.]|nr:bifunctional indole-3-glycerol phosphate synthase/phosphoribosylanthranilate isomerase [Spirochaeta sp.]